MTSEDEAKKTEGSPYFPWVVCVLGVVAAALELRELPNGERGDGWRLFVALWFAGAAVFGIAVRMPFRQSWNPSLYAGAAAVLAVVLYFGARLLGGLAMVGLFGIVSGAMAGGALGVLAPRRGG